MGCGCGQRPAPADNPRTIPSTAAGEQLRKALREAATKQRATPQVANSHPSQ